MLQTLLAVVLGALIILSCNRGALYIPIYWIKAKRAGTGMPQLLFSLPFGFRRTKAMSLALQESRTLDVVLETNKTNSPTRFVQLLLRWQMVSNDPENIKAFLSTQFKDFNLGFREESLGYAFGKGIFTVDGKHWKHSRGMLRPQFARDQISQLGTVSSHAETLFKVIDNLQKTQEYVDIQYLFHQFTIDTATEFLFGESLDSLDVLIGGVDRKVTSKGRTVSAAEFVESYQQMVITSAQRLVLGEFGWLKNPKIFNYHIDRARVVVDYYVDKAIANKEHEKEPGEKYVFSHALARENLSPIEIRDQIFNILIAGRDTTAVTMMFTTYHMAKSPEMWSRLREEILEEFGTAEEDREVTFEKLRTTKYLNAVINEILRLYPVVPLNQRTAVKDVILPRGGGPDGKQKLLVTKGTSVGYHYYAIHRDPTVWGPDAEEFNPDRWMVKMNIPSWAYLPFNGGPRICIGQQFALTEIAMVVVRMAQRYRHLEVSPDVNMKLNVTLTIKSNAPVLVRFKE